MALTKQAISINFSKGLDLKTDPFQVQVGNFLTLENTIFDKGGLLQKRNGFMALPSLPNNIANYLTTFNTNLTAIGNNLEAYSAPTKTWVDKGQIQRTSLSTLPLIRSNTNQSQADSAISLSGFVCTVYTDNYPSGIEYKYAIADATTGQNIVAPTVIPTAVGTNNGAARVFVLGAYFIIVQTVLIGGTNELQYIAISTSNPTHVSTNFTISSLYTPSSMVAFDAVVANNNLFIAWNGSDGSVKVTFLDSNLVLHTTRSFTGQQGENFSVVADTTGSTPIVYVSYFNTSSDIGSILAVQNTSGSLTTVFTPQTIISGGDVVPNITMAAQNGVCTVYYEVNNNYGYDSAIPTHFINTLTVTGTIPVIGPTTVFARSVGLASKAFIVNGIIYLLTTYQSPFQPTYFLFDQNSHIVAKLAYSNGGGYLISGLPSVTVNNGNIAHIAYLIKDLISSVNKNTNVPSGTPITNVYSQTGINLVNFTVGNNILTSAEIGGNLNISGALVSAYDGYSPVEQGFNVWPDSIEVSPDTISGANMSLQEYFYQVTYEWSDNQGNMFRSSPSVPVSITLSGGANAVIVSLPTLRLTYKLANPVKICIYRWSQGQQIYYQTTSIITPLLNDPSVDFLTFFDTNSDAMILGNNILYTNGGVIENIGPPASDLLTLYQNRLFLVDSEDKNLLWFSKQVIENTPVEMSDLLTIYVAPTTSAQGSTGPITALSALDDKLIIFKKDAIYYINGQGPDNTGANNNFSDATFITATVGCTNQNSIVFMPQGLMFQSDKGIWLLGRDLSTNYIGSPVEQFNDSLVLSALNIPGTNQVRFTLASGITLMYDYFYNQWGTFTNVPAVASTLYNSLHTYINNLGQAFQEQPNMFLDGSKPVLMSFTTSWLNLAGVQGFERFYHMFLLGTYITPFNLNVGIAFDYGPQSQFVMVSPEQSYITWGSDALWGSSSPWGGPGNVFEARVFPNKQKVESFQISITEIFDSSQGTIPGAGLTLSGLNLVIGLKKGYRTQSAARSFG